MSLILALGSNLEDKLSFLALARAKLNEHFVPIAESRIFKSEAVDYLNQPDFFNQVVEYKIPKIPPVEVMEIILKIELELGRTRKISKGPRTIDIDIIFWGLEKINETNLTVPHYAWCERSFVVLPLKDLPYYQTLKKSFIIPNEFNNSANPI